MISNLAFIIAILLLASGAFGFGLLPWRSSSSSPHCLKPSPFTQMQYRSSVDYGNQIDYASDIDELSGLMARISKYLGRVEDLMDQLQELERHDPLLATITDEHVLVQARHAISTLQTFERLLREERRYLRP